eukprot:TRINITY_DN26120_c0_g1_i14.p1 TRINITY_DN26120_c0_g1~~TRINITY_DN26120_c0_g1_i14.p1  ORF type:complete len:995 (-),score=52.71 TRINITY_DN26120_c0_g1_i14:300-3284(-)
MCTASRASVARRPLQASLMLTALLWSLRGTLALAAQNASGRHFAVPLPWEQDDVDLSDSSDDLSSTREVQQLDALYQIWLSLDCKGKSWKQRGFCPEWAYCYGGWVISITLRRAGCSGSISSKAWIRLQRLKTVSLHGNALTGRLPVAWRRLPLLSSVYLWGNHLSGALPAEWGSMKRLRVLVLSQNHLSGALPAEWGSMKRLRVLELEQNHLSGALPAEWGSLETLKRLRLNNNTLSTSLPRQWSQMSSLRVLNLADNELQGHLPAEWSNLSRLEVLRLENNNLRSVLPSQWRNMKRLKRLDLSHNRLSGTLPVSWEDIGSLLELDLQYNWLSGALPAAWGKLLLLEQLSLASNQLVGSLPAAWSNLSALRILSLDANRLSGVVPPIFSRLHGLQFLALHENRFSGPLPKLSPVAKYNAVLLHSNEFSGRFEEVGTPNVRLLVALPGNYLIHDPDVGNTSAATTEPFVDLNSQSPFFRPGKPPWKTLTLVIAAFSIWLGLKVRLPPARPFIDSNVADAVLQQTVSALYFRVFWHGLLACVNIWIYSSGGTGFCSIWDASGRTAAYCKGHQAFIAFLTIPMTTSFILPTLVTLPRHALPPKHPELGLLRRVTVRRVTVWLLLLACTLITGAPSLLNVFFKSAPSVHPSLFVLLPIASAVLHVFVQPAFLRKLASFARIPYYKLQVLQGASSWALPLAVSVWISPECRGSWWGLMEMCQQTESWTCNESYFGVGVLCRSNRTLDVSSITPVVQKNSTHFFMKVILSAEEVCGDRWPDPLRCTSSLVDVIGVFIFNKHLVTCFLTLGLLLAASVGSSTLPWWTPVGFVRTEEASGTRSAFVFQSTFFGIDKNLISLSEKFSPTLVLARLSVWTDISLSWGLLYPPIAIVGLIHLLIERWCYEKGRCNLRFPPQSPDDVVEMPRSTMIAWLMAANILGAVHAGSVVVEEPSFVHFAIPVILVVVSWVIGFRRGFRQLEAAAAGMDRATPASLELPAH